jgi:hypothetical protein
LTALLAGVASLSGIGSGESCQEGDGKFHHGEGGLVVFSIEVGWWKTGM